MTTKYMNTTGITLHKFDGEAYCAMIDVIKLIHHEMLETNNKQFLDILDRMEARVARNAFIADHIVTSSTTKTPSIPGRYAVSLLSKDSDSLFYAQGENNTVRWTSKPCEAKLYVNYRDASAAADFLAEFKGEGKPDPIVADFESLMSEESRWIRALKIPFPYDADEGFENSIPIELI